MIASSNKGSSEGDQQDDYNNSASFACTISLHVPTSSVQFGPDILEDEIPLAFKTNSTSQPRRPHPGGLDTLVEASHANALSQATGPSPMGLQNSNDVSNKIDSLVSTALATLSPASKSRAITRAKGYNNIAIQLTNERWRERWSRLCLAAATIDEPSVASTSNLNTTNGDSWEVLAQISGAGGLNTPMVEGKGSSPSKTEKLFRSTSRKRLSEISPITPTIPSTIAEEPDQSNNKTQFEAELWRKSPCFHPGEVNISKFEDAEGIIAIISPWLELDSIDEGIRLDSEIALRQELTYASHLGITSIILPPPSSDPACRPFLADYARAIAGCLISRGSEAPAAGHFSKLIIRLPISSPYSAAQSMLRSGARPLSIGSNSSNGTANMRAEDDWTWQSWHIIQAMTDHNPRLSVALDFSAPLPPQAILDRWFAEPVSCVWLPAKSFLSNAKGYPVLSKAMQAFLRSLINVKLPNFNFILTGTQTPPENHTRGGQAAYEQYIRHLERSTISAMTENEIQNRSYADYLQAPLQPLFDHLEGQTYATFEADTIKYEKYEEAITQALSSLSAKQPIQVWICGAGRGPLVNACVNAAKRSARSVRITALEKNPNAIVGLRERAANEWGQDVVQVQLGDMRSVSVPRQKADVIVSELLGSFGDNELSPECLDGAMRILKPNGICIPRAYSSYITPICTPKLFGEVSKGKPLSIIANGEASTADQRIKAAETPYIVMLRAVSYIAARGGRGEWQDVQHCWTFDHSASPAVPKSDDNLPLTNAHNVRISSHTFHIPRQAICHGLAGFFEAHLWGNVALSIHPDITRATPGMMSWFPIYFPFKEPLFLASESELDIYLWRMTSNDRVWYEWLGQSFISTFKPTRATSMGMESETSQSRNVILGRQNNGHLRFENNDGQRVASDSSSSATAAFQNALNTPRLMPENLSGGLSPSGAFNERLLVGMTSLMNPGGRSSSVRM